MIVSFHAIISIISELLLPTWQKEARDITYQVIQAMEVARLEISFYSREMWSRYVVTQTYIIGIVLPILILRNKVLRSYIFYAKYSTPEDFLGEIKMGNRTPRLVINFRKYCLGYYLNFGGLSQYNI